MYLYRLEKPTKVNDEYNNIDNVVAEIISDFIGHETIIGYVYINHEGKLRREYCGWL